MIGTIYLLSFSTFHVPRSAVDRIRNMKYLFSVQTSHQTKYDKRFTKHCPCGVLLGQRVSTTTPWEQESR